MVGETPETAARSDVRIERGVVDNKRLKSSINGCNTNRGIALQVKVE